MPICSSPCFVYILGARQSFLACKCLFSFSNLRDMAVTFIDRALGIQFYFLAHSLPERTVSLISLLFLLF